MKKLLQPQSPEKGVQVLLRPKGVNLGWCGAEEKTLREQVILSFREGCVGQVHHSADVVYDWGGVAHIVSSFSAVLPLVRARAGASGCEEIVELSLFPSGASFA